MSDEYLVLHAAPTLAGLKTGNLFAVQREDLTADAEGTALLHAELERLNQFLVPKGLHAISARNKSGKQMIYLYRLQALAKDLAGPVAARILSEKGYPVGNTEACILEVLRRLAEEADFPHELGLFLGYPPEDVLGFMEHPAEGVKCVGIWKVYGDRESAEQTFRKFRRCTDIYREEVRRGRSISRLTVRTLAG